MKTYTDLEQSKKLAKILPLESADMWHHGFFNPSRMYKIEYNPPAPYHSVTPQWDCPCWSLAALLGAMICPNLEEYIEGVWDLTAFTDNTLKTPIEIQDCKDPVDACVEMIIKLNELKML